MENLEKSGDEGLEVADTQTVFTTQHTICNVSGNSVYMKRTNLGRVHIEYRADGGRNMKREVTRY